MKLGFGRVYLLPLALALFSPGVFAGESPATFSGRTWQRCWLLPETRAWTMRPAGPGSALSSAPASTWRRWPSILAVNWNQATPEQRARFVGLLTRLLEDTYVGAIESYTTETVRVGGERIRAEGATVIVTILRRDGTDIPLLFKLRKAGDGWRAYDANIEGVSLVSNYRSSFAEIVKNRGVEGLLVHLEQKLAGQAA